VHRVRAVEESGGEARTYLIDDDLILKVQRPQQRRPLTSLAKEVFFLQQLEVIPVSVPHVIGHGRQEPDIEYTLLTRIPGSPLRRVSLAPDDRRTALIQLGRTLRRIHDLPVAPFIDCGIVPGDLAFMDTMTRIAEPLLDRSREVRERGIDWSFPLSIEQIAGRALSSLPHTQERAALHSNPYEEHTFVNPASGVFTGLIDFGDAYISHPALDIRRWNRPADREAILAGYQEAGPVSDDWLVVWRALMIVADVTTMVQQTERTDEARRDLEQLLRDL
jgi:aminoglycoside phosphotransferase (APT) family kinase protein